MKEITEIIMMLDKSGSMTKFKEEVIGGFNDYMKEQQLLGRTHVTTVVFDKKCQVLWQLIPAEETVMDSRDYQPGGMTALLDTIGATLEETRNRHETMIKDEVPSKVIVVIMSDGMDNASRAYTYESVSQLIETQQTAGWEFVFMGANLEAGREAYKLKIKEADAYYHPHTKQGITELFKNATNVTTAIRRRGSQQGILEKDDEIGDNVQKEEEIPTLKLPKESKKTTYQQYMKHMHDLRKRNELNESFNRFFQVMNVLEKQIKEEKKKLSL